jgi:hypothetical protein
VASMPFNQPWINYMYSMLSRSLLPTRIVLYIAAESGLNGIGT